MEFKSVIESQQEIWAQIIWQIDFTIGVINGKNCNINTKESF
jgi:hypothetical protein